ncbi:MAG: tRNA epoxyqueuosine(34) reductase QueG [Polaromonas sp.]
MQVHPDPLELGREAIAHCEAQGFALAGICPVAPTQRGPELDAWLAAGKHGDMAWLESEVALRKDPARELSGARSMILVADQYADGAADPPLPQGSGRIARYARGRDYHWFIKRRLHLLNDVFRKRFPGHKFRSFVDTAPVLEREHAARAGLGWIGKHTLLIHPRAGSYLLLGGTLTTMNLRMPEPPGPTPDACGACTRCIDACPTGAITPYSVDARRCIAYLTIEHRGPADPTLQPRVGDWIFGCDVCQEVCPHNTPRSGAPRRVNPAYQSERRAFDLIEMLGWTLEQKRKAIEGSAMKRADLDMLKRNAVVALGNQAARSGSPGGAGEALAALRGASIDQSLHEMVRQAAAQALDRLARTPSC